MATFENILMNPSGVGTGNIHARYLIRQHFESQALRLYSTQKISIHKILHVSDEIIYIHMRQLSETIPNIFYDVVFIMKKASILPEVSFYKYATKVFSNSPSFSFTYYYAFKKNSMFADELKSKVEREFNTPPTIRNPHEESGFEKSLATCAFTLHLLLKTNNIKSGKDFLIRLKSKCTELKTQEDLTKAILKNISSFHEKFVQYNYSKSRMSKASLKAKKKKKEEKQKTPLIWKSDAKLKVINPNLKPDSQPEHKDI